MIPIVIAGMAVARLVAPVIAKKLIREGIAKPAAKAAKVSPSKPITSMNQLPNNLIKPPKPSTPSVNTGKRTVSQSKELMARTKKNRNQVAEAKNKARSPNSSVATNKPMSVVDRAKQEMSIAGESASKIRGAEQARGSLSKVPSGQKGMRLPSKGETVKRKAGGKIMSGDDLVRGCYD